MSTTFPGPAVRGRQLSLAELRAVVEQYAARVRAGEHVPEYRTDDRYHVRIHQDDDVDVWLISWTTEQGTELHDHGGSSGAFTVVSGTLTEYVWTGAGHDAPGMLVNDQRRVGDTVAFGPEYVHDVRNHQVPPAVSVHAYSPPISLMHYYDASAGNLPRWASAWTDDPEAPAPERAASYGVSGNSCRRQRRPGGTLTTPAADSTGRWPAFASAVPSSHHLDDAGIRQQLPDTP